MKINIKGYKNIDNLEYEIIENKLNVLIGISGSGKSSIIGALKNENIDFHKKINYKGEFFSSIDQIENPEKISVYSEEYIDRYLFSNKKDENIINVLIDNENEYTIAANDLNNRISNVRRLIQEYSNFYDEMLNLQVQLGAKLTKTNKLKSTSPIKKLEASINNLGKSRIYKKLSEMEIGKPKWIIEGIQYIHNTNCPYCDKKLSSKKYNELLKIEKTDFDSKQKLDMRIEQLDLLKCNSVVLTNSGIKALEKQVIALGIAIQDFDKLTLNLTKLYENENISRNLDFTLNDEFFAFFPNLKSEVNKLVRDHERLTRNSIKAFNNTKLILNRKLSKINSLFESFGIPYEIEAEYRNKKIINYKLYLKKDDNKLERINGLSVGERKLISLIFFIIEQEKSNNELIIFDDPVSSYDENRRYSLFQFILNSLKDKTVLILSHDQLFAKFATDNNGNKIGRVSYFDNYEICSIIEIDKSDFSDIKTHIRNRVMESTEYFQKVINMRYFYEFSKRYNHKVYSYLSTIIHKEDLTSKLSEKKLIESEILMEIKEEFGIDLPKFDLSFYNNINTKEFSLFEKLFLLREKLDSKKYGEIVNHIHLNSKFAISLNPYIYSFCSNYIYQLAKDNINEIFDL